MKPEVNFTGKGLQITRIFAAPRQVVFGWWTQAEKLKQWSGCKEATRCEIEMDFRVGGSFTQKMQIGTMCEFTITGMYEEIVVPERIAYRVDLGPAKTRVVVEFIGQGDRTKVILTHEGLPDENFGRNVSQGTLESFDKLEACLAAVQEPA